MKAKIIALVIEAKRERDSEEQFCFHPLRINDILSGLSVVYDEVFIWSVDHHLIVWIVGSDVSFLAQFFDLYRHEFKKLHLHAGMMAQQIFKNVAEGKMWEDVATVKKLDTLQHAYELTHKTNSLGPTLFPFVSGSLSYLQNQSIVYGSRHSWNYRKEKMTSAVNPVINIESKDTFYRFCIN